MTLTHPQRVVRCQQAITGYSDDDIYTNIVDFLADAMHWCHFNGYSFEDLRDTALMHFEAEINGDDIVDNPNPESNEERNNP